MGSTSWQQEQQMVAGLTDLQAQLATLQGTTLNIPQPSTMTPSAEATTPTPGTNSNKYSQEGHQHPRLTSTTYTVLAADGTATVMFTRSFINKPGFSITEIDATGNQPLTPSVQSFVKDANGFYTGCVIKCYRSQVLPTLTQNSGGLLLTSLISAVNAANAMLSGFNIFGGAVAGASVSVVAIARSDVPA